MPDRYEDYAEWLKYEKLKWKIQAFERKRARVEGGPAALPTRSLGSTKDFFEKQSRALVNSPWQIIQIAPTSEPGRFNLWALMDRGLHKISLVVPRVFYVNARTELSRIGDGDVGDDDNDSAMIITGSSSKKKKADNVPRKVTRTLPRNHRAINLYEITMDEKDFTEKQKVRRTEEVIY